MAIITPKERASNLIYRYQIETSTSSKEHGINQELAIQCCLIAVDLILNYDNGHKNDYWGEVKQEILKFGKQNG
jgi:hypothetical protein